VVRIALLATAAAIAWSRVYLGVHWPLDMLGGLLTGMCGCLAAGRCGRPVARRYQSLQQLYRFASPADS
jgi:undecaprenyl-diphosphatase